MINASVSGRHVNNLDYLSQHSIYKWSAIEAVHTVKGCTDKQTPSQQHPPAIKRDAQDTIYHILA
jgi:hypothetical protein